MVASRRSGCKGIRAVICIGVLGSAFAAAHAQPAPARLKSLVADLNSEEISRREEAMEALSGAATLAQLEELLKDSDLTAEQRCRIAEAAKQRFMNSPRPAMGVQFDSRLPDRVSLSHVYDKFPSAQLLEPGDIIVSCNGEKLRSRSAWVQLGAHIFSREPGESVSLVVRRGAQKLNIEVPLGTYGDLPAGNNNNAASAPRIDDERLQRAWELRCSRYAPAERAPIDAKIADDDWRTDELPAQSQKLSRYKPQLSTTYRPPRLVAGGEPRGGEQTAEELLMLAQQDVRGVNAAVNRAWAQQQLQQRQMLAMEGMAIIQTTAQELSSLNTRRDMLERQLDDLKMPGATKPEQMVQLEVRYKMQIDELARVKKQIEAIKAEAAEAQAEALVDDAKVAPSPR